MRPPDRLCLVAKREDARANIARYATAALEDPRLLARAAYARSWYADRDGHGGWRLAPSKFVGYHYGTARDYLADAGARGDRDGRQTERTLARWFAPVPPDSPLGRELHAALEAFLARAARSPNAAARVNVEKGELDKASAVSRPTAPALPDRISIDPQICGGRPCIQGTRVRVSDILAMMAEGASRAEILADFDYLVDADLSAALAYAARASDHRVIKAA
jgi:uncharacterized protein (DUF433 family)